MSPLADIMREDREQAKCGEKKSQERIDPGNQCNGAHRGDLFGEAFIEQS